MLGQCFDCTAAFLDRWAFREGDTPHQILTKRVCTTLVLAGMLLLLAALVGRNKNTHLRLWSVTCSIVMAAAHLIYLRLARRVGTVFLCTMSSVVIFMVTVSDLSNAAETGRRMWPFAIILVDILLVVQAPTFLSRAVVLAMCLYLSVIQAEVTWRFGLFDLPIFAPYEDRHCYGTCNEPPCAREFLDSFSMLSTGLTIFLLDFYFTRGFAVQVQREKEKITAAVTAAQHVAERLASFDLDAAEHVLENQEDMPPDLCESLRVILSHLRAYKPFLPQSVFAITLMPQLSLEAETESGIENSSSPHSSAQRSGEHAPTTPPFVERRLSLLHLHTSLPDVAAPHYTSVHSQMLATVLKHAATCKGVVDHFCGDAVSLSYNASSLCARHPMMAVQTAAALCLEVEEGVCAVDEVPCVLRGGVATGHARVGTMGVPELQRHCIVGMLDTVCQHIVQAAVLLERPLLCLHSTAVDVAFAWQTRVLLHRLVFDLGRPRSFKICVDNTEDPFGGSGSVVYEVVAENVAQMPRVQSQGAEWMYELEAQASSEWDAYNRAGLSFHRSGGDAEAALHELRAASTNEDHIAMFSDASSASRVLAFCPRLQSSWSHDENVT